MLRVWWIGQMSCAFGQASRSANVVIREDWKRGSVKNAGLENAREVSMKSQNSTKPVDPCTNAIFLCCILNASCWWIHIGAVHQMTADSTRDINLCFSSTQRPIRGTIKLTYSGLTLAESKNSTLHSLPLYSSSVRYFTFNTFRNKLLKWSLSTIFLLPGFPLPQIRRPHHTYIQQ